MPRTVHSMTEQESKEVEKMLLHISDARSRARRAAESLGKVGGSEGVTRALRETEGQLAEIHRSLSRSTYYAVPDDSLRLAV